MAGWNKGDTWQAILDIPVPDNFSLDNEIVWPKSLVPHPSLTAYETPDTGQLRLEIFCKIKPKGRILKDIQRALLGFLGIPVTRIDFHKLAPEDWVTLSLEDLESINAGRFFVHGSHLQDQIPKGKIPLMIDTGFAFGTGHHETTKGCLLALDKLAGKITPGAVLDLGCGSGILAFAAKKLWPTAFVFASDNDLEAVRTARQNARKNSVPEIEVFLAEGFDHPGLRETFFDLVIANILTEPLKALAPEMAKRMGKGGLLILSGLFKKQEEKLASAYKAQGFRHTDTVPDKTWPTLILEKSRNS